MIGSPSGVGDPETVPAGSVTDRAVPSQEADARSSVGSSMVRTQWPSAGSTTQNARSPTGPVAASSTDAWVTCRPPLTGVKPSLATRTDGQPSRSARETTMPSGPRT